MSRLPPGSNDSGPADSSPPPGKLQDAIGLKSRLPDPVWPQTRKAIEDAGYTNLDEPSSGARGATGAVFKARDGATGRRVALKVILDPTNERSLQQMRRERDALCAENLPRSVVRYLACLESPTVAHQPVLVLEYIDGKKIHDFARAPGQTMADRIDLCRRMFEELALLHDAKMLFGDLSPNNVLVESRGDVRFIDFGQARRVDPGYRSVNSISGPGGTDGVSSKAVLEGERRPEPRDDVRAAAATAFLVLTGHRVDHDRGGKLQPDRVAKDWFSDLLLAGIPKHVARTLVAALRDADAPRKWRSRPRTYLEARAVAESLAQWFEQRRRVGLRLRLLAAMLLIGLPLGWLAFEGWQQYRTEVAAVQRRSAEAIDREIRLRPNLSHPAVANELAAAEQIRSRWHDEVRRGDAMAERSLGELLTALRGVLSTSHEVESIEPLRASLGEVLVRTPWSRACPTIAAREAELGKRFGGLGETMDKGDLRGAWTALRSFQGDLAKLAADNVLAMKAEQARAAYRRIERGVAARLRALPGWQVCSTRAADAERLLQAGQFDDTAGPGATTEFGQARVQLEALLTAETPEERRVRLAADVSQVAELEGQLAAKNSEIGKANDQLKELQALLARVEKERNGFAEGRAALLEQIKTVEQQRDAAEKARLQVAEELVAATKAKEAAEAALAAERELATKARTAAEAELATLRGEVEELRKVANQPAPAKEPKVEGPVAGTQFVNGIGQTIIYVASGTSKVGSPEGEVGRSADELQHSVTITKVYGLAATEITQKQWFEVMGTRPWRGKPYVIEGDDVAATYISWNDAVAFCRKLSERERAAGRLPAGYEYCPPTEAEWECAARAGSSSRFAFGDDEKMLRNYAVYSGARDGDHAHAVKSKKPNAWGFFDMHGNVWEWCADFAEWSSGVRTDTYVDGVTDPLSRSGSRRVFRGGSWSSDSADCRSAYRSCNEPDCAIRNLGFRPALAARSQAK